MTPKNRNHVLPAFTAAAVAVAALSVAAFVAAAATDRLVPLPTAPRTPSFLARIPFAPTSFAASVASCAVLPLLAPPSLLLIMRLFGKKLPLEVVFFSGFLLGCLCEASRLVVISTGLWQAFSDRLLMLSRVQTFGRTLAPTSFLFAALMSEPSQRQSAARHFLTLLSASMIVAVVTPMNTSLITSTGAVVPSFAPMFDALRISAAAMAAAAFLHSARSREQGAYTKMAAAFAALSAGYAALLCADNFALLAAGIVMVGAGIPRYLLAVHELYVWN